VYGCTHADAVQANDGTPRMQPCTALARAASDGPARRAVAGPSRLHTSRLLYTPAICGTPRTLAAVADSVSHMMVIHANAQILLLTAAVTATNGQLLDGCAYTNDGECDETRYCPPGSDTADCCEHGAPQVGVEAADVCCAATGCTNNYDWCRHARDGRCDEPRIGSGNCPMDSDATDCIAEEVDCSDMTTVLAEVNRKCCTLPSTSATAQSGHRRAQVGEECVLDTCSVECARVFVGMMNGCNAELTTAGADLSVLSEIAGAREFFRTCEQ
jgi:hypothetical protein